MPLHTRVFDQDLEAQLPRGRVHTFFSRYETLRQESGTRPPQVSELCADRTMGLDAWSSRLLALPDGDFLYTHYGAEIESMVGFTMTGRRVSENRGLAFSFFRECYERVFNTQKPLLTFSSALATTAVASWRRLILPAIDDAEQVNLITVLEAIDMRDSLVGAMLQSIDDPVIVIRMIRGQNNDPTDAQLLRTNEAATALFKFRSLRHLQLSDCAPQLLEPPFCDTLKEAYSKGVRAELAHALTIEGETFQGLTACANGDGALVILRR